MTLTYDNLATNLYPRFFSQPTVRHYDRSYATGLRLSVCMYGMYCG